jgi:hypoxanthine phosphoribosyltransferase
MQSWWRKRAKTRTLDEKERMKKRGRKSTETESFIFPSKQRREKNNLYSYKRE